MDWIRKKYIRLALRWSTRSRWEWYASEKWFASPIWLAAELVDADDERFTTVRLTGGEVIPTPVRTAINLRVWRMRHRMLSLLARIGKAVGWCEGSPTPKGGAK